MSEQNRNRMRVQANRLGFDVSDGLVEQCLATADQLRVIADDLHEGSELTVVSPLDGAPSGEYNEFLGLYDEPRQENQTGTLTDVRIALKDNIAAAGLPMTCGSDCAAVIPERDAVVTERLLDDGTTLVGKTNMDAFAFGPSGEFSDYRPVKNPTALDRVPGGSSSGSAVAVAAGTVDVALGSDTGGSIRIPAACSGVVGAKPTHSAVPRHGFVAFAPSLDTVGPLSADVETAARTLDVLVGPDDRDTATSERLVPGFDEGFSLPPDATVGLPTEFFDATDDEVADPVRAAVDDSGLETTPIDLPRGEIEKAYFLIASTEFVWYLDQTGVIRGQGSNCMAAVRTLLLEGKKADFGDHVASRLLAAAYLDTETNGEAYLAARRESLEFTRRVESVLRDVDALVMPTLRTLPPGRGQMKTTEDMLTLLGNTAPFNLARTPAVSVPVATVDGLPVGAQIVGSRFGDLQTLAIAAELN